MYAPNGSIPEISIDGRCKLYCKVNIKDQNTSAVDSQLEIGSLEHKIRTYP
jgi:hypothetical protein